MQKISISKLGKVGLVIDGDHTLKPPNAFTDCLNVKFNGREISPYLGNQPEQFFTQNMASDDQGGIAPWDAVKIYLMRAVMFDAFSSNAEMLFCIGKWNPDDSGDVSVITGVNLSQGIPTVMEVAATAWVPDITKPWSYYKEAINNCVIFGQAGQIPIGKAYNWVGFDVLPSWGEQTTGNDGTTSTIVTRRWECKKVISFDNRLLALNTTEESAGGVDVPYPSRVRWSGFAQENAFPINWDDTAANRTPEDYAAAVIDGFAGWQDLSSNAPLVDAVANGNTLYVYTERETYSMTPSGNDQKPFITNMVHSDLGVLDIDCVVNARGYNYVFTGSDVVRHDSVSWVSIADDYVRDYLANLVQEHRQGMVRMTTYPDLGEIWVMIYGTDQDDGDYAKTTVLTYSLNRNTWAKKSLPHIFDTEFLPMPPESVGIVWDVDTEAWDNKTQPWDNSVDKVAQGQLCGSCAQGGVYYLNASQSEWRSIYSGGTWTMQQQAVQRYVERRGLMLGDGDQRAMISSMYIQGNGTGSLTVTVGSADSYVSGYKWETQTIDMTSIRRPTFRQDGELFGYRLEMSGDGQLPSSIIIGYQMTGYK
ncbi:Uncharacterised protein [Serratia quinivorans]|uniref:hypothetical protein n=1 Tax=Serratia quinivorans TaxID=137545 RepID=UPI002178EE06|nr:hypothetical protein [Serratia quinivorans]CAI1769919.1 Uncharacterised protein [Serratia quinivorans]